MAVFAHIKKIILQLRDNVPLGNNYQHMNLLSTHTSIVLYNNTLSYNCKIIFFWMRKYLSRVTAWQIIFHTLIKKTPFISFFHIAPINIKSSLLH